MKKELEKIKELRERTGAGMVESQRVLVEAKGDIEQAVVLLRKSGQVTALKKQGRATKEGVIGSYVHANKKIASLVEVSCETDFVARTEAFQAFAHELAMQVVASNPLYLAPADVPESEIEHERSIARDSKGVSGKPAAVVKKIVDGKLEKFFETHCLLKQPYIKDGAMTIEQLLADTVTKFGENIKIGRFVRYQL